jgi:hypothetical protein
MQGSLPASRCADAGPINMASLKKPGQNGKIKAERELNQ